MFLLKKKPYVNSQRNIKYVKKNLNFTIKSNLNFFFIKKKISLLNKNFINSKKKARLIYFKNSHLSNINGLTFIIQKFYKNLNDSVLGVIKNWQGSFFSINIVWGVFFFDYINITKTYNKIVNNSVLNTLSYIIFINKNTPISNIFVYKNLKKRISSASGVFSSILTVYELLKLAVIVLPSNKKNIVPFFQLCLLGRQSNIYKKYEKKGTAGFNYVLGKKPVVRGVAKNPVDHPHGGRTKSVQPEVSPWGWITKNSH